MSLYFQFALCPYPPPPAPPSPVPCLGSEEGRCSRRPGPVAVNHWSAAQNDAPEGRGSRSSPQAASLLCTYLAQAPAPPLHPFRPGAEGVFGEKKELLPYSRRPTADAKMSQDGARSSGGQAATPACVPLWPPGLMEHRPGPIVLAPSLRYLVRTHLRLTPPWASTFHQ